MLGRILVKESKAIAEKNLNGHNREDPIVLSPEGNLSTSAFEGVGTKTVKVATKLVLHLKAI